MQIAETEPVLASLEEAEALKLLVQILNPENLPAQVVGRDGKAVEMTASVYRIMGQVIQLMAKGRAVSVMSFNQNLTPQEAAYLLNLSYSAMIELIESGEIKARKEIDWRIKLADLMAYKQQQDIQREEVLTSLAQMTQNWGLYELESELYNKESFDL
ncbi:MAG: helix-turn-helix domain-containing protein [Hormoscilla sp. GM102CHS1]|nr:helix-turn-helix domain-containing protein [Hormoscilla sp. GM102CHS1]